MAHMLFIFRGETLGLGPGHRCYITSTAQSPVSLRTRRSFLPSAVKIASMFLEILRISAIGPYNLPSFRSQHQILDPPPFPLVANMFDNAGFTEQRTQTDELCAGWVYIDLHIYSKNRQVWC